MDLVRGIQDAVNPVGYSIYKSEERMTEALGMVLDVKERLPQVAARTRTTWWPPTTRATWR